MKRGLAQRWIDRRLDILEMRGNGATLHEIGVKYKVTRERIRQILNLYKHHYKENNNER